MGIALLFGCGVRFLGGAAGVVSRRGVGVVLYFCLVGALVCWCALAAAACGGCAATLS